VFSQLVIEQLGYYVYFLKDSRSGEVFYVGKGKENRVFDHLNCSLEQDIESDKLLRIRDINDSGGNVIHYILRHGLTESSAFEIEASLIDFIGMENLSNFQSGHYSRGYGLMTSEEVSALYETASLATSLPILLININKLFRRDMTNEHLYHATRESWVVGSRRYKAKYAVATYRGLTREVYEIQEWYPVHTNSKVRWGFNGQIASEDIRSELRYKSIENYFRKGAANPVRYVNCG
jgi:uncharacterized protein